MAVLSESQTPRDHEDPPAMAGPTAATNRTDRSGFISVWFVIGALALVVSIEVLIRWVTSSTQFKAAPILGPDHYGTARLITLRVIEAISALVFVWLGNRTIVAPMRTDRRLGIDGLIFIGCFLGAITDGVLDMHQYLFAWNAHSINLGSWSGFLPFHSAAANPRYAESLVWGLPMYVYFCIGVAISGTSAITALRRRFPSISDASAYAVVFLGAVVFDFVVENAIIRLTQAYSFAKTTHGLTLWAGSSYQFPIYECLLVGALGTIFTAVRLSALESADGLSFVEQGLHRFRPGLQPAVRIIAVFGFCVATLLVVYHLPINWLGVTGTSVAHLPSYLRP